VIVGEREWAREREGKRKILLLKEKTYKKYGTNTTKLEI